METLAGGWWATGAFWQFVVTTVVSLAVGALGTWAALRAGNPKLKINWWVESNTALMSLPQLGTGNGLTIDYNGRQLTKPRIIELMIANQGKGDITGTMFHNGDAIRFDCNVEVLTVFNVATSPSGTVKPTLAIGPVLVAGTISSAERWIDLQPSLLSRGQIVSVTVLVDGDEEPVKCERAPLVNVQVVSDSPGRAGRTLQAAVSGASIGLLGIRIRF